MYNNCKCKCKCKLERYLVREKQETKTYEQEISH